MGFSRATKPKLAYNPAPMRALLSAGAGLLAGALCLAGQQPPAQAQPAKIERIAFVASERIAVMDSDGTHATTFNMRGHRPAFSRDGEWIAFSGEDGYTSQIFII